MSWQYTKSQRSNSKKIKSKTIVEQLLYIVGNDRTLEANQEIIALKDKTTQEQIDSISATAVAVPVTATVGIIGMLSLGVYSAINTFHKDKDASCYKNELDFLDVQRGNLNVKMEQLQTAMINQQKAL
jgi:hypothetical protein